MQRYQELRIFKKELHEKRVTFPLMCLTLAQVRHSFASRKTLSYRVVFIGILVLIGTLMDIFLYLFCGKKEL